MRSDYICFHNRNNELKRVESIKREAPESLASYTIFVGVHPDQCVVLALAVYVRTLLF
jgi:hypothetical protein